ncbi:MAG: PIN domain-containing protein [Candidatus Helarchaeota archaeon]
MPKNLESIIKPDELQILLNKFDNYDITFPLYSKKYFIKVSVSDENYEIRLNKDYLNTNFNESDDCYLELPNNQDVIECLLASGCISYSNISDFNKKYNIIYKNINKKFYFAVDTNILYHKFISSSFLKDNTIIIAPTIINEIESSMNFKYYPNLIQRIKKLAKCNRHLLTELKNRRRKKSRKAAYLALNELHNLNTYKIESKKSISFGYERNDLNIVLELKNYERETDNMIILLTADRAMIDFCKVENLDYFIFQYPNNINIDKCLPSQFRSLIFNLAVVFGVIKLNSTYIFGEFLNKNNLDDLKIRFLNNNLYDQFLKDLHVCRKLKKLNFDF